MIHIQEHLHDQDQHKMNLIDLLHESMAPLASLYRELNKKTDGNDNMALVLETLLNHSYEMQAEIVKYLTDKTGPIKIVMAERDNSWLFRTSEYITGMEINGKLVK